MVRLQGELAVLKHNMDSEVSQAREEALSVMQITGGVGGVGVALGTRTCTAVPTACGMLFHGSCRGDNCGSWHMHLCPQPVKGC